MTFGAGGGGGISNISGAADVAISNKQNGQVLAYDSGIDKWRNGAASGGAGLTASKDTAVSGNVTLTAGTSAVLTKFAGSLTANRTITLSGTVANAYFDISLIDTTFNGFSITVTNGTFSHQFSYPTFVKYVYIGSAWERVL